MQQVRPQLAHNHGGRGLMSTEPPSQTGRVGSAARMEWLRGLASRVVPHSRCQGCGKRLEDGEPVVRCGRRKFVCAACSNAEQPLKCRKCRHVVTGLYGYRVRYAPKSGIICADCREKSALKGLPSRCRGCLREIAAGEPLVYCRWQRYICSSCADALQSTYCKGCHRTVVGEYVYLHRYAGNQRNPVCGQCSADILAANRCSRFAEPLEVEA